MRKMLLKGLMVVAAMLVCLSASAIDKVVKSTGLDNEVTSLEELYTSRVILQNAGGKVLCIPSGWDCKVSTIIDAISANDKGVFYELQADGEHYLMPIYNLNGDRRSFWAGKAFVNSQPGGGNVIFGLAGDNEQRGQDGPNLALWDVTYEEGQGFAFHCVGRDVYLGSDAEAARPSSEIVYWKAYKSYSAAYVQAEVEAAYEQAITAARTAETIAALEAAKAAFDSSADLNAFGDAVNAAIDAVNACQAVNAEYANLDEAGAAVAADVLAKYENKEYANIAELRAAYILAAKAQTTAGANMTGAIVNPSFELGTLEGWTSTDGGAIAQNYNFAQRTGDKFVERWTEAPGKLSDGSLLQTLTEMPNGEYTLTAEMHNMEQGNGSAAGTGFYLVANDDKTAVAAHGETVKVSTVVTDGTLIIGTKLIDCSGNWICEDNFQLTYLGMTDKAKEEIAYASCIGMATELNTTFGEVCAAIATYDESVQTAMADKISDISSELTTVQEAIEASHSNATSDADAAGNIDALTDIKAAIAQLDADAAAAQKAYIVSTIEMADLAEGDYIIQNVATGKFLGGANSWGTQASLVDNGRIFTLSKLENGKYNLDSHTYDKADKHFLNNGWVDGVLNEIAIYIVEGGYAFGTDTDNCYSAQDETTLLATTGFVADANSAWKLISVEEAIEILAASETGDATFLLKNASISRNLYNPSFENAWQGDSFSVGDDKDGEYRQNKNAEVWNKPPFNIYQTIKIPNGVYNVSVQGFYRYNNTNANTNEVAIAAHADGTEVISSFLYANDKEVSLTSIADEEAAAALGQIPFSQKDARIAFEKGLYNNTVEVTVTDGSLTVGIKKKDHIGADWTVWDNFIITKISNLPAPATYAIAIAEGIENGTIVANVETAEEGATVTLTATPAEGYKLEAITVTAGEASVEVTEAEGAYTFVMPAAAVTVSATFAAEAVEPTPDPNLIEIAQSVPEGTEVDGFVNQATKNVTDDYTEYTFKENISLAFKMLNVDVKDCDYVVIKFAEPTPAGLKASFVEGEGNEDIPEGVTEWKNIIADNPTVKDGIIPQITLLTIFGTAGTSVKVEGVYKHKIASEPTEPELAKVENMTLTVAEDAVMDDKDKTFPVVFGYKAIVDESISPMASMSVTYKVTTNGEEILSETFEGIDTAKETQNIWIKNMEYGKTYTVTITSVSVSYFDLETLGNNVAYTKTFAEDELTATFTTNAVPVSIDGINAAAKANRKVVENGRVVIYKNGVKTMSSGVSIR